MTFSPELEKKLRSFALRAHQLLNALDVSRTDIRLDDEGNPREVWMFPLSVESSGKPPVITREQVQAIEVALARIPIQGERYPEHQQRLVGR